MAADKGRRSGGPANSALRWRRATADGLRLVLLALALAAAAGIARAWVDGGSASPGEFVERAGDR